MGTGKGKMVLAKLVRARRQQKRKRWPQIRRKRNLQPPEKTVEEAAVGLARPDKRLKGLPTLSTVSKP